LECGYDPQGIASDRCPECGWLIDRTLLERSQVPWPNRRAIGRWRAYWRTVWMACWRVKRIAIDVGRPVAWRDARRFSTIAMLLATLPVALAMLAVVISDGGTRELSPLPSDTNKLLELPKPDLLLPYAAGITLLP